MEAKRIIRSVFATLLALCLLPGCSDGSNGQQEESQTSSSSIEGTTAQDGAVTSDLSLQEQQNGKVSVYAGTLLPGARDGDCLKAQFIKPYGLCSDMDGNLLAVDCYANLLRIVDGKTVSTLAGNAESLDENGYPAGGTLDGPSGQSLLNRPRFAAVSKEGAVVFSDTGSNRIRVVYDGMVTLLAGTGTAGFQDGDYKTAQFQKPSGVAIGADGTIYVADTLNHCIRAISATGEVSTLAGTPQKEGFRDGPMQEALFCEPNDIELGDDGALYVVDKGNQRIRKIENSQVSTIAGSGSGKDSTTGYIVGGYQDGEASKAMFQYPTGLCYYQGVIFVADTGNNCIRAISNGRVATVTGTRMSGNVNGGIHEARFNQPIDVLCANGRLYISDSYNHVIRAVEWKDGKIPSVFSSTS